MPRLGSLQVCERVILDQTGKPSLISLFQKINSVVPRGQLVPKDALAAMQWSLFSEWFFTEEELAKQQWEQVVEVMLPDGAPSSLKGRLALKSLAPAGLGSRGIINLTGIPVFLAGPLTVNTWLEQNAERVTDIHSYMIVVEHVEQAPTPNDGGSMVMTPSSNQKV